MPRRPLFATQYKRPTSSRKITAEGAQKHQNYLDGLKQDAEFYCVEHMTSALIPHSVLFKIIHKLKSGNNCFTLSEKNYLQREDLVSLRKLIDGEIDFDTYKQEAINDRMQYEMRLEAERMQQANIQKLKLIEAEKLQQQLREERLAREKEKLERQKRLESNPKYMQRQREKALFTQYDIYYSDLSKNNWGKLIHILQALDSNQRLSPDDAVWLVSEGSQFFSGKVKIKFYRTEADFYLRNYQKNQDLWSAINASSALRKAEASKEAEILLEGIKIEHITNKKLISAYLTTLGGVKRDEKKATIAIELATKAHENIPEDYRPCTLLGAVHMETGGYELGYEWYSKAKKRGAPERAINDDLKKILKKLNSVQQQKMIDTLIAKDDESYLWLKQFHY